MLQYIEMTVSDVDALAVLFAETFNAPPWNDKWTKETAGRRLHQLIQVEDFYGLCVYDDGELCGMILGGQEQWYDGMMFQIKEFCVRNKRRGQGLGARILEELEQRLKAQGVTEIMLLTCRDDGTEGFYGRHGYHTNSQMVMMGKEL